MKAAKYLLFIVLSVPFVSIGASLEIEQGGLTLKAAPLMQNELSQAHLRVEQGGFTPAAGSRCENSAPFLIGRMLEQIADMGFIKVQVQKSFFASPSPSGIQKEQTALKLLKAAKKNLESAVKKSPQFRSMPAVSLRRKMRDLENQADQASVQARAVRSKMYALHFEFLKMFSDWQRVSLEYFAAQEFKVRTAFSRAWGAYTRYWDNAATSAVLAPSVQHSPFAQYIDQLLQDNMCRAFSAVNTAVKESSMPFLEGGLSDRQLQLHSLHNQIKVVSRQWMKLDHQLAWSSLDHQVMLRSKKEKLLGQKWEQARLEYYNLLGANVITAFNHVNKTHKAWQKAYNQIKGDVK